MNILCLIYLTVYSRSLNIDIDFWTFWSLMALYKKSYGILHLCYINKRSKTFMFLIPIFNKKHSDTWVWFRIRLLCIFQTRTNWLDTLDKCISHRLSLIVRVRFVSTSVKISPNCFSDGWINFESNIKKI